VENTCRANQLAVGHGANGGSCGVLSGKSRVWVSCSGFVWQGSHCMHTVRHWIDASNMLSMTSSIVLAQTCCIQCVVKQIDLDCMLCRCACCCFWSVACLRLAAFWHVSVKWFMLLASDVWHVCVCCFVASLILFLWIVSSDIVNWVIHKQQHTSDYEHTNHTCTSRASSMNIGTQPCDIMPPCMQSTQMGRLWNTVIYHK